MQPPRGSFFSNALVVLSHVYSGYPPRDRISLSYGSFQGRKQERGGGNEAKMENAFANLKEMTQQASDGKDNR